MILYPPWGGKNLKEPLWPNPRAPEWAQTVARRMHSSGVPIERICEILAEMRKARIDKVHTIETRGEKVDYTIIFE